MVSYRWVFSMAAAAIGLLVLGAGAARADTVLYSNGFETDTTDWSSPETTRVPSGTGGITSKSGSFHATAASGAFSRWGNYNYGAGNAVPTVFKEYTTKVDVYLNLTGGWANNTRFDFSSAINTNLGVHFSDFIFNGGFYDSATDVGDLSPGAGTNRFVISASNNSQPGSAFAKNPGRSPIAISSSGWYTFTHHFYDNGGNLAVDMSIFDATSTLVNTWNFASIPIAGIGGNRYGWFDYSEFPTLAIDNAQLSLQSPAIVPTPKSVWAGMSLFVCLIGAQGIKRLRRQPEMA